MREIIERAWIFSLVFGLQLKQLNATLPRYAGPPQLYAVPAWLHEWCIWWRGLEAPSAVKLWLRSPISIRIARFMNAKNAEGAMAEIGGPQTSFTGAKDADWRPSATHMWQHLEPEN